VRFFPEAWKQIARPGFQRFETHVGVIDCTALVVRTANDQRVARFIQRLEADIVIIIKSVPIKRVREDALWQSESHSVGAVRSLLGMYGRAVIDRGICRDHCGTRLDLASIAGRHDHAPAALFRFQHAGVGKEHATAGLDRGNYPPQVLQWMKGPLPEVSDKFCKQLAERLRRDLV
jgi:hypothetical protein